MSEDATGAGTAVAERPARERGAASTSTAAPSAETPKKPKDLTLYVIERRVILTDLVAAGDPTDSHAQHSFDQLEKIGGGAWVYVGESEAARGEKALEQVLKGLGPAEDVPSSEYRAIPKRNIGEAVPVAPKTETTLVYGKTD